MSTPTIIIIYDTYCGWCYGAAPMFDALVASGAKVTALHRYLFRGSHARRMVEGKGALIRRADARIAALTGRLFSQQYLDQVVLSEREVLESGYSAQAAALVRPQGVVMEFAVRAELERARYIDGVSASDRGAVVESLVRVGVARAEAERLGTPGLERRADRAARRARHLMSAVGARRVPTLLWAYGDGTYGVIDHTVFYGQPQVFVDFVHNTRAVSAAQR